MGTVYLAEDLELRRRVAIKVLAPGMCRDEHAVERFEREARLLAKLDHPNIVPVYSVGRANGLPYIVMKFLEGETLSWRLHVRGRLTPAECLPIVRQIC